MFQRTRPSRPPDKTALPKGAPKRLSPREKDRANEKALIGENSSAVTIRRNGYDIEQLREIKGRRANPDYMIEGSIFECYTPQAGTPVRNIHDVIAGKVPRQAERMVLNMDNVENPDSLIAALKAFLIEHPIPDLKEVLIVRGGRVSHF